MIGVYVLSGLDRIPWSQLQQAHGRAGHVPEAVRDLLSHDTEVVTSAYWQLDNYVVLQSDLYEAAAYLPEFLIESLQYAAPVGKAAILDLLYEIANGYAPPEQTLRFHVTPSGELRPLPTGEAPAIREACWGGVLAGVARYEAEVQNPDRNVSERAAELLELLLAES